MSSPLILPPLGPGGGKIPQCQLIPNSTFTCLTVIIQKEHHPAPCFDLVDGRDFVQERCEQEAEGLFYAPDPFSHEHDESMKEKSRGFRLLFYTYTAHKPLRCLHAEPNFTAHCPPPTQTRCLPGPARCTRVAGRVLKADWLMVLIQPCHPVSPRLWSYVP
ncbi:hypothetical protein BD779DRAFT_1470619 [Infundibulicybe gibba]|nr:hypothetical protein BD779DRAFT_1470619 [Infundibulicybe gibba]